MIHKLIALLRPWKTTKALHEAPQSIVEDLLTQQRMLEESITGRSVHSTWTSPHFVMLLVALAVTVGAFLALLSSLIDQTTSYSLQSLAYSLIHRVRNSSSQERLIALAALPWLVGTVILWTTHRR